jgi:ABC-type branched-subunit amino acid transport system substrate-binding protein
VPGTATWGISVVRTWRRAAGFAALALVSASCGNGDDSAPAAGEGPLGAKARSEVESAITASTIASGGQQQPGSVEEWQALWAQERAAIVEKIKANGWGRSADGTTLTGPDGFTVDLSRCTSGWSETEGLTDTTIKYGMVAAQSGPQAVIVGHLRGAQAVFHAMNAAGGFPDITGKKRTVSVVSRDDGYDPARAIPLIDELIDSEKVFAISVVGSPSVLRTYDKLNARCIPQDPRSGHPALGDPVNHPWTPGTTFSYTTEAVLWGTFIEQHLEEFGDEVKVAGLVINNDFGDAYSRAFEDFIAQSPHKDRITYTVERVEAGASTVTDQMTTIAAGEPDVFLAMLVGTACLQVVTEAAQNGMKEETPYKFLSSTCKGSVQLTRDVAGDAGDGWWAIGGGLKDMLSAEYDDDPWVRFARDAFKAAGLDHRASSSSSHGVMYAWGFGQAMLIAGMLDGGLTRSNLLLALRALDMTNPQLLPGVAYNMRGNTDAYLIEGSEISRYDLATEAWVQQGATIDVSGQTKICAWNAGASRCA